MAEEVTHKEALALVGEAEIARLRERSDLPALLHLGAHVGLFGVTGWAVLATHGDLWLVASIAHGVVLSFLFTPLHETVHGTAFRTQRFNDAVAEVSGFLLLLPPRYFRFFHFAHHRHTQDLTRDPELSTPRPANLKQYAWYLSGLPYWGAQIGALVRNALGALPPAFVPASAVRKVAMEARLYLLSYAVVAGISMGLGRSEIVWLWVIPALLGQPFLRAYLLAEHAACPLVADMLVNTRTTFTSGFVRFLAWNMPHHTAHHALPTVPFHRLPELTALLEPQLQSRADGYLEAHRQVRRAWHLPR
ncbi:MAG: fatty acid desaturase [Pseudomonadota bacterium]|nr:fatty acid desaturase [Pseudomonadota bacterium]